MLTIASKFSTFCWSRLIVSRAAGSSSNWQQTASYSITLHYIT